MRHQASADEIQSIITELRDPAIIRVFIDHGLVETVTGIPDGHFVRIIDLDTEGSDESDTVILNPGDIPPDNDDINIVRGFVTDHLPDGTTDRPYDETGGDAREE